MLISIVLDPHSFSEDCVRDKAGRDNAVRLMQLVYEKNVVLLSAKEPMVLDEIHEQLSQSKSPLTQKLLVILTEIKKSKETRKRCVKHPYQTDLSKHSGEERIERLAIDLRADVVVANRESGSAEYRVCPLSEFFDSDVADKQRRWDQSQRLDDSDSKREILGKAIAYATTICIADPYFGTASMQGRQRRFARGVVEVARAWCAATPYPREHTLVLTILTAGGKMVSPNDHVDPEEAGKCIKMAIENEDEDGLIGRRVRIDVKVKQDKTPRQFQDRFLSGGQRCFGLRHGVDGLAPQARSPAHLDPDCKANRDMIREIRRLQDADLSETNCASTAENLG